MAAQRTLVGAKLAIISWILALCTTHAVQAQTDPLAELYDLLGIQLDADDNPIQSDPAPSPTPIEPVDPVDPIEQLILLGVLPENFSPETEPLPAEPVPNPAPVDPFEQLILLGILPDDFDPNAEPSPVAQQPAPLPDPMPVEIPFISQDEIDFFAQLGIELDENGNVVQPEPIDSPTPVEVIDTQEDLVAFFAMLGITVNEQGLPVPADPTPTPPPITDPIELFTNLGLPLDMLPESMQPVASIAISTPEPSTFLLALLASCGAVVRRRY